MFNIHISLDTCIEDVYTLCGSVDVNKGYIISIQILGPYIDSWAQCLCPECMKHPAVGLALLQAVSEPTLQHTVVETEVKV